MSLKLLNFLTYKVLPIKLPTSYERKRSGLLSPLLTLYEAFLTMLKIKSTPRETKESTLSPAAVVRFILVKQVAQSN